MSSEIIFNYKTANIGSSGNVGHERLEDETVAKAKCPFCDHISSFRQVGRGNRSRLKGQMVALKCPNCGCIISASIDEEEIFPKPKVEDFGEDLPDNIQDYYDEGVRCLGADAPNGAATVFRKVIHAVCMYYDITEADSNDGFYDMIQTLSDEEIITESLRQSLLGVKDAGNDGAHINNNDPTLDQAKNMKEMIEAVLTATVVADEKVNKLREEHPNPHQE
ncbi:hypothetical protein Harman_04010 [Haloarcula mannanilytica]|uniref:DUF4145 domain-containing protein n=1 Tax=Haloarcula mannanilytica TaxID=2509225 RepID=A0A4C2EDA7_9EURY|nr:DUF4145 domain-containing protein [Haloarcula mannanilytica]GCF12466.1 hypothetical protein Harman_04010 [Haloarcula mannanilytica]